MPDKPPPSEPPKRPLINEMHAPLILQIGRQAPDIPEEQQLSCDQCGATVGTDSRFCWSCGKDFDRARMRRYHPVKLLALSLGVNLLQAALAVAWYYCLK